MNFFSRLFVPKTANSKLNALLGFMHNETLTQLAQGAKEKLARLSGLATGQITKADAEIARQDLILQRAILAHEARTAKTAAEKAAVEARLANLQALVAVADEILGAEIGTK